MTDTVNKLDDEGKLMAGRFEKRLKQLGIR